MAPIDKIGGVSRGYTTPVDKVTFEYSKFGSITTAEKATIAGFNYINPGYGDGYNTISFNQNVLADGNGLLNLHGKYTQNELGQEVPPTRTMMFMA